MSNDRLAHFMHQPTSITFGVRQWMIRLQENGVNGILADEMGLGKVRVAEQALSLHSYFRIIVHTGDFVVDLPKRQCNPFQYWFT